MPTNREPPVSSPAAPTGTSNEFRDAFFVLRPQLRVMPENELRPVNRDVMVAVTTVLGALPRVRALGPALSGELPRFDQTRLDRLHTICLALSYAQANAHPPPPLSAEDLVATGASGHALREKLLRDGLYLASYQLLDGRRLADIKSQPGYRVIATDLLTLVTVFEEGWAAIAGKTMVTHDEIELAVSLARKLLQSVGERAELKDSMAEAVQMRQRAFTLLVQEYDQVQRAVTYLLWDDPDQIEVVCPSLYPARRGKPSGKADKEETPASGGTTPGGETKPDSGAKGGATPAGPVGPDDDLPGGNPFLS